MKIRHALVVLAALAASMFAQAQDAGALFTAVQDSDLAAVRAALEAGADVNATNSYGATPLFAAADRGNIEIVRVLLENGADPNVSDTFYGATPVGWAMGSNPAIAILLLEHGADGAGQVIMQALQQSDADTAMAALRMGPLPRSIRDRALELAADAGHAELEEALRAAEVTDPPPPFEFDAADLPRYEGMYRNEDEGVIVEVSVGDDALHASNGDLRLELAPVGPNTFAADGDRSMAFGGRGTVIEWAQYNSPDGNVFLSPVDPDEAALLRRGGVAGIEGSRYSGDADAISPAGWPSFRGHDGSGNGDGKNAPISWNAETGDGVVWKTPLPGLANSSPIAWGDHVFVTAAVSSAGDDTIKTGLYGDVAPVDDVSEHRFFLTAMSRSTGEILWERDVFVGVPQVKRHTKSSQANSTPVTDGEVVVVLFGSVGALAAYDFDGNEKWSLDLGAMDSGWFYDPDYQWGHSASPILYEETVILQVDVQEHSYIAAFNLTDGSERWRTPRDEIPSWATPVVYRGQPRDELVTNAKTIRAYDPKTGEELWTLEPNAEVVVGSPILGDGVVYITAGYPPARPIYAVRPGGSGDISLPSGTDTSENMLWSKDRGGTYIPTPLLYRGILYTNANNGRLTAYDAANGEMLYRARIGGTGASYVASPVAADGNLYFSTEDGTVHVVKAGPEYELVTSNEMGEVIWATPAITDGLMIVRTLQHVYGIKR